MYTGHAVIALALETREPRMPIVPLALACYGPDWLHWFLGLVLKDSDGSRMSAHTHSVSAVIVCAFAAAAAYALVVRRPGVRWIFVGWLSHWPADFLTGRKPLTGLNDLVGLHLYSRPWADFGLESAVIVAGCALYGRTFAGGEEGNGRRWMVVGLAVALIALQGAMDLTI